MSKLKGLSRKMLPKAIVMFLFLSLLGCAGLISLLPKAIAIVTDAQMILDRIEDYSDAIFSVQPNPRAQRNVEQTLDRCRTALNVALRTTTAAKSLSEEDVDAAFEDFRKAYKNLLTLVEPLRVKEGEPGDKLAATSTSLSVPPPLAFGMPGLSSGG